MSPQFIQMLMSLMNQQGGGSQGGMQNGSAMQDPNRNYFNPGNGNPYSSQKGLMGGSMGGGSLSSGPHMPIMGDMGAGIGGIASGLFNLFGSENPSDAANPYLDKMESGMGKYMNPFIQRGQRAGDTLESQYNSLTNDPTGVMNKIGSTFHSSPGYGFQTSQAEGAANRAAAAGGMLGSPAQQQEISGVINGLANQDYYNYLNHGTDMYKTGLNGLEGFNNQGYGASNLMAQGLMQQLMAQAQNAYAGSNTKNQQMGGGIGSLVGGITSLFGL